MVRPLRYLRYEFKNTLRSPLIWRITLTVFCFIVAIEAVLLASSYTKERDRQLATMQALAELALPLISINPGRDDAARSLIKRTAAERYPVLGGVMVHRNGARTTFGNAEGLDDSPDSGIDPTPVMRSHLNKDADRYNVFVRPTYEDAQVRKAWLRFDASQVRGTALLHVLRIIGLIFVIAVFVGAGCLLVLSPLVLHPLQRITRMMKKAQATGIANLAVPARYLARGDEIGDVYRTFEKMRHALVDAEQANLKIASRFQDFADLGADCFWETDGNLRFTFVAGDVSTLFGVEPDRLLGGRFSSLITDTRRVTRLEKEIRRALHNHGLWEGQLGNEDGFKDKRTVRVVATPVRDEGDKLIAIRGIVTDITETSELARELKHQATHDALTGLINRQEFDQKLAEALTEARRANRLASICLLDLDRFKLVNDSCGHAAGDVLLRQVADLITDKVRSGDLVARFGGDEFAVLLFGCELENALIVAEKIRAAVDRFRFVWNNNVYDVGVSIGVAQIDPTYAQFGDAMRAADASLFEAKQLGRNRVQAYTPTDTAVRHRQDEMQWMGQITQALAEDRLILYQQPICPVFPANSNRVHFEVLLRLLGRDGEIFSPGAFLPAAERYRLIDRVDRRVIDATLSWLSEQRIKDSAELIVSVNLSGTSVTDPEFQRFLVDALAQSGVNPRHLCFEITETSAIHNLSHTADFLSTLRTLGCHIGIDDFGAGFSSLGYLKQLPIDFIKIDGAFIRNLRHDPLDQKLVHCIAEVAKLMKVQTIAEFVEDAPTMTILQELGIDMVQGYLLAAPAPLVSLTDIGRQHRAAEQRVRKSLPSHIPRLSQGRARFEPLDISGDIGLVGNICP